MKLCIGCGTELFDLDNKCVKCNSTSLISKEEYEKIRKELFSANKQTRDQLICTKKYKVVYDNLAKRGGYDFWNSLETESIENTTSPTTYSDTDTDSENIILMWVGLVGAIVCFFGFLLSDNDILAYITSGSCIAFGVWRSNKLSPTLKKQIADREKQKASITVKCPYCQSTNTKKISTTAKVVNTAVWGIFGTKRHKEWHCNDCGSDF